MYAIEFASGETRVIRFRSGADASGYIVSGSPRPIVCSFSFFDIGVDFAFQYVRDQIAERVKIVGMLSLTGRRCTFSRPWMIANLRL